jgi:hypothetical protein
VFNVSLNDALERVTKDYTVDGLDIAQAVTEFKRGEAQAGMLNLLYALGQGKLYADLKKKHGKKFVEVIGKESLSQRQVQRYLSFFLLCMRFKRLLNTGQSFKDIVYYATVIKERANTDPKFNALLGGDIIEVKYEEKVIDIQGYLNQVEKATASVIDDLTMDVDNLNLTDEEENRLLDK